MVFLLPLILLFAYGCTSGTHAEPIDPPYQALEKATQEAENDSLMSIDQPIPCQWWTLFNDDQLSEFIETALANNPTLQSARTKIQLANAQADRVRANLFPNLVWGGDVSRQKFSETGVIPFNTNPMPGAAPTPVTPGQNGIPVYFTQYETELILTYDFDIWGKNRNTLRAAIGEVRANMADEAFARLQLAIAIARVYYNLQIDYKRQEIAQALVNNQVQYLDLIQHRVDGNLDNSQVIHNSKSNIASAQQGLLQIQADIAINEHQLQAYLAGNFDETVQNNQVTVQPLPQVPIPECLPVHLIAHRPDIIAQLWLIESAGKQIDVAKAGFYPDFNITAIFGYQTIHLPQLFKYPSTYYNVDPAFTLPIFDGGRLIANLNSSEINYDLAIYQYNNLILNAVKEVLDGIAILRNSDQQLQELKSKVVQQDDLLKLTNMRIEHNINSGLDYLTSEQNLLMVRDQEVVAFGNTIQAILSLIKALGGGYQEGENG